MHPFLVKRLIYPWHERLMGRPTLNYLREIEAAQWLPRAEMEALQMRGLKRLLQIAVNHCPWHRERIVSAGIDPLAPAELNLEDLRRLPTMDKDDIRKHRERMIWKEVPGGLFPYTTGGSSGQPLQFHIGKLRQAADAACRARSRRWWGQDIGDREVYLWGAPVELNKTDRLKKFRDGLLNQLLLNAFEMRPETMDGYLRRLEEFRPVALFGYASSLDLLARHAQARGLCPHIESLRLIMSTGEPLYSDQRERIRSVFGTPVASEYGCRDGGLVAVESPDGQMLASSETLIVEILDESGLPVAPGEVGEVVLTHLCSDAQPFIRYRTGDLARQSDESCRNGRGLQVIGEVMGRRTDFIVRRDGTIMHGLSLIYVLREIAEIRAFRLIQHDIDRLELMIVPDEGWNEACRRKLIQGLEDRLGEGLDVDIDLLADIPPEPSGKHRCIVSKVAVPV